MTTSDIEQQWPWTNNGYGSDFVATRTEEDSFSPSHSLKISKAIIDTAQAHFWVWYNEYKGEMPFGQDLTLTAKIKGVDLLGPGASIVIRCDRVTQLLQFETTENSTNISGSFDWSTYTLNLSDLQSDVTIIRVYLILLPETTGTVYFDDITLTHK